MFFAIILATIILFAVLSPFIKSMVGFMGSVITFIFYLFFLKIVYDKLKNKAQIMAHQRVKRRLSLIIQTQ